jgi:hypothetical protein
MGIAQTVTAEKDVFIALECAKQHEGRTVLTLTSGTFVKA